MTISTNHFERGGCCKRVDSAMGLERIEVYSTESTNTMSFVAVSGGGPPTGYVVYDSMTSKATMDTNSIRPSDYSSSMIKGAMRGTQNPATGYSPVGPFDGQGLYSSLTQNLYDDCFLDPMQAHYGSQGNCAKLWSSEQAFAHKVRGVNASLSDMRQNGTSDLPDHFSRYGYNSKTGTCRNGYCLGNHNGRYIVGEQDVERGIYADPVDMAPPAWYEKQAKRNSKRPFFP